MAFRHGPLTFMGRCGSIPWRHPSGILVSPYELRLDGKYHRADGVDLTSGRKAEGTTVVSGSKKAAPFVHRAKHNFPAYVGGDDIGGVPV